MSRENYKQAVFIHCLVAVFGYVLFSFFESALRNSNFFMSLYINGITFIVTTALFDFSLLVSWFVFTLALSKVILLITNKNPTKSLFFQLIESILFTILGILFAITFYFFFATIIVLFYSY